jgi:hypothetical protein
MRNNATNMRFIRVHYEKPKKNIPIRVSKYVYLKMKAVIISQVLSFFLFLNYLLLKDCLLDS